MLMLIINTISELITIEMQSARKSILSAERYPSHFCTSSVPAAKQNPDTSVTKVKITHWAGFFASESKERNARIGKGKNITKWAILSDGMPKIIGLTRTAPPNLAKHKKHTRPM